MNINIRLNNKSIQSAIERLQKAKAQIPKMLNEFLKNACDWFIDRANRHLDNSDIGKNVVNDIKSHWRYSIKDNVATIINDSDKAVFVEFGVGQVGGEYPHPNAEEEKYQYNKDSDYKFTSKSDDDYWIFHLNSEEDLDMHPRDYLFRETSNDLYFLTKGSWGEMFAFNTIIDMTIEHKAIKGLWQQVKEKYWR
jgi:hypothetical protein